MTEKESTTNIDKVLSRVFPFVIIACSCCLTVLTFVTTNEKTTQKYVNQTTGIEITNTQTSQASQAMAVINFICATIVGFYGNRIEHRLNNKNDTINSLSSQLEMITNFNAATPRNANGDPTNSPANSNHSVYPEAVTVGFDNA